MIIQVNVTKYVLIFYSETLHAILIEITACCYLPALLFTVYSAFPNSYVISYKLLYMSISLSSHLYFLG